MPAPKNKLEELLQEVVLASGLEKSQRLQAVRAYIASISIAQLNKEIAEITNRVELTALNAAGVPAGAQTTFYYVLQRSS